MSRKIAFLFIGQSPRPDVMDDVAANLDADVTALEYGALDGLSQEQIGEIAPLSAEDTLITKLKDGSEVCVSHKAVERLLEERIAQAGKDGASLCAIMCTGSFDLKSTTPLITADKAFHGQESHDAVKCVGVIVPLKEQQETFAAHYRGGLKVVTGFADPYGETDAIVSEAKRLADAGAEIIRLDCMGYTTAQASAVRRATGLQVRTPRIEILRLIQKER